MTKAPNKPIGTMQGYELELQEQEYRGIDFEFDNIRPYITKNLADHLVEIGIHPFEFIKTTHASLLKNYDGGSKMDRLQVLFLSKEGKEVLKIYALSSLEKDMDINEIPMEYRNEFSLMFMLPEDY